jgi:hypothetical protein
VSQIGSQDGIVAAINRWRDLDPAGTLLKKKDGKWPDISTISAKPLDEWKAYDKLQRTLSILKADHDAGYAPNPKPPEPPSNGNEFHYLHEAQARIFLAQSPLDCLTAPSWMVPVVTADHGYRDWYTPDVIQQLYAHFGIVEAWCDCRVPSGYVEGQGTGYDEAVRMTEEMGLSGPPWGQCENASEFENAWNGGARRMIGQLSGLLPDQLQAIEEADVLLAFELYRNKMPWQVPDYGECGAGIGGNAIGCYASESEGSAYYPVAQYKAEGYYVPKRDSVYGVGLKPQDWLDLA